MKPKPEKRKSNNLLTNLLSQMVDGSAACATITTSSLDKSASDAKKTETTRTLLESLSTSEKLKTRKPRSRLLMLPVSINLQDHNSNNSTTTECLNPNLSEDKSSPWVELVATGLANDAPCSTKESSATSVTSHRLKAEECSTNKEL